MSESVSLILGREWSYKTFIESRRLLFLPTDVLRVEIITKEEETAHPATRDTHLRARRQSLDEELEASITFSKGQSDRKNFV